MEVKLRRASDKNRRRVNAVVGTLKDYRYVVIDGRNVAW
jgi:hypothetical protein